MFSPSSVHGDTFVIDRTAAIHRGVPVRVKRLDGHPLILLWQKSDGATSVLNLVEEDARSIGPVTWKGLELLNADDSWREEKLKPGRRASRDRVTARVHASTFRAEGIRTGDEMGGVEGVTVKSARAHAEVKQNARRGGGSGRCYGIVDAGVEVDRAELTRLAASSSAAESSYSRRLAHRLSARTSNPDAPEQRRSVVNAGRETTTPGADFLEFWNLASVRCSSAARGTGGRVRRGFLCTIN